MEENVGKDIDVENRTPRETEESNRFWITSVVAIGSLMGLTAGLYISLSGPTLLYLADNVHASVGQVSSMFTGRSVGVFVGTMLFGAIMNRNKSFQPLMFIGIGVTLAGVLMLIIPWITNLAGLVTVTTLTGVIMGFYDAGIQSFYLRLWGQKKSRPFIQSYHFAVGIGGLIAPIISSPFLQMADQQGSADESCPDSKNITVKSTVAYEASTTPLPDNHGLHPVAWTYIIMGTFTMIVGILTIILSVLRLEDHLSTNRQMLTEQRPEEPLRALVWLFIPVLIYYAMVGSVINVYQSYIYSVALCSGLSFSVTDALTLNTTFWLGFSIGRGAGIFYAKFFEPSTMIIADLLGVTIAMIILSIFGEYISLVIWIVTIFQGLAGATLYATGVSWTSSVTNVSSTYILIFGAGSTVGQMTMLPLGGVIFDIDPFSVIYQVCAMSICIDLAFIWMTSIGRRHLKQINNSESKLDLTSFPEEENFKTRL